jgi:N,N'-diacetyllegionaminate synthase
MRRSKSEPVIIIAEAGVNHNGDVNIAIELVDEAAKSGADYVKFQTFKAENLVTEYAKKAKYQQQNGESGQTQYQMLKELELNEQSYQLIIKRCKQKNIGFLSSAFDLQSIEYLSKFKLPFIKIPSGEITNLPYLRKVASLNSKIFLSTGLSNMNEIENALSILIKSGAKKTEITVLHCNSEYPTPFEDVNLNAMKTIGEKFNVNVGYSDHTIGTCVPIAAVALGASVIEKHFTLDKNLVGPDHSASLEPKEFRSMVESIRSIEVAMGNGIKKISTSEKKNLKSIRKSIVASRLIKKGELFSEDNIDIKRPGNGVSPMKWDQVLGKIAPKIFEKNQIISLD